MYVRMSFLAQDQIRESKKKRGGLFINSDLASVIKERLNSRLWTKDGSQAVCKQASSNLKHCRTLLSSVLMGGGVLDRPTFQKLIIADDISLFHFCARRVKRKNPAHT